MGSETKLENFFRCKVKEGFFSLSRQAVFLLVIQGTGHAVRQMLGEQKVFATAPISRINAVDLWACMIYF
jgi:hypothetical protein